MVLPSTLTPGSACRVMDQVDWTQLDKAFSPKLANIFINKVKIKITHVTLISTLPSTVKLLKKGVSQRR